jgi:integrative and conjugative element protein (TIGR02256 family)
VGDWSIVLSEQVATAISGCRRLALPAETGGVLLGVLDMEEQSIHVGLALDAPAGSAGDESGFERGIAGLRARIARATEESAGQLVYVGEWHSHPEGYAATPSPKDLLQLAELADLLDMNGVPALMAIANDDGIRIHSAARHELGSTYSAVMVREARP